MKAKRKICFPITSRVHYARQKLLLENIQKNPKLDMDLVVGGAVLLEKYGERFHGAILKDGFEIKETLFNVIDGGSHVTMAKTAGLTALEFSNSLHKLDPDIVLIRGDRFEQLAMAMTAAYMNKTIAHIEGGDVTGSIDESVRHAITKLSHIHFVTNEDSKRRIIQMGENPSMVFNVGSLDVEFASIINKKLNPGFIKMAGVGAKVNARVPFLMVIYHPVTTATNNRLSTEALLKTVDGLNMPAVWFWPNNDAGTDEIAKTIRNFREKGKLKHNKIRFITDILPEDFIRLLKKANVLVGNSSAGIKESSYLGIPVVNIGTRQAGRLRGPNVTDVGFSASKIRDAILGQLKHGPYPGSEIYYKPDTSKRIVEVLSKVKLYSQKKFYER